MRVGATVMLHLPEHAASGFRWTLDGLPDCVTLESSTYRPAAAGIGSGGHMEWVLKARRLGDAALTLKLWRDWEGDASIRQRFEVTLAIRA